MADVLSPLFRSYSPKTFISEIFHSNQSEFLIIFSSTCNQHNIYMFSAFLTSLIKELPSSILFSSRIWLTVHSEKAAASSVFLHRLGEMDFYFLLSQSKITNNTLGGVLDLFSLWRVNFNYRCRSINTATLSLSFLPRHAGIHEIHGHMRDHKHVIILHYNDAILPMLTCTTPELE